MWHLRMADATAPRGADHLVRCLKAEGVSRIYALSGNQIMSVFDACLDAEMPLLHCRHEAACGYMAEAHAQLTGETGVALVTAGAGLANALAPLMTAQASQTPLLLLSGDSPVAADGHGAFQEMDQTGLTRALTKASVRVMEAGDVPARVTELLRIARSGTPGPVHLSLPDDVLKSRAAARPVAAPAETAALPDISALQNALAAAARPLILLGPELSDTRAPGLRDRLQAVTSAPVLCLQSPRGLNDPRLGAWKTLAAEADCVIALGKPVDFTLGFGAPDLWSGAVWHVVSPEAAECDRAARQLGTRLHGAFDAEARRVAERVMDAGDAPARAVWLARADALVARRVRHAEPGEGIGPQRLCAAVQKALDAVPEPLLICDGGEFGQWAQACCRAPSQIINGVSGAIGGGLCYAIGARAARPSATVFALMGDGTVGFHLAEFETAMRAGLPFVAVIGNDGRWNAEHLIQQAAFGADRTHACTLSDARYDLAVAAMGGFGVHVTRAGDLDAALTGAVASGLPACVNVQMTGAAAPTL